MTANRKQLTPELINLIEDIFNILIARTLQKPDINSDSIRSTLIAIRGKTQWVGTTMEKVDLPINFFEEIGTLGQLILNVAPFFKAVAPIVFVYNSLN